MLKIKKTKKGLIDFKKDLRTFRSNYSVKQKF